MFLLDQKGACANGEGSNKNIQNDTIRKSMKKRYKFHARTRGNQKDGKSSKSDPTSRWKVSNNSDKKKKKETKTKYKKKEKRQSAQGGDEPDGAPNTIRSKIEDKLTEENKLTEEKLKDRESAAHANTPWAPSGPERIEVAYGKVPLQARAGEDACENTFYSGVAKNMEIRKNC